ncbi:MAG: hypothetical protein ABIG85_04325 [Chloroflexota bacterium]
MRLTSRALEERIETLVDLLRGDGDVSARHSAPGVSPAMIDFRIEAPGGRAGREVSFRYAEIYEREVGADWVLVEYVYLMASQTGSGRREYHWHPLRWSRGDSVYHAHCVGRGSNARGHFRSHRLLLEEARAEFLVTYAAGEGVDCTDLYPLSEPRP